jgi:hypothetical protein
VSDVGLLHGAVRAFSNNTGSAFPKLYHEQEIDKSPNKSVL